MKTNLRVAKIQAADRARAAYTQKNSGKEGYSLKALEQIAKGNYRKVPELRPNTTKATVSTTSSRGSLSGGNKTVAKQRVREHSGSGMNLDKQTRNSVNLPKTTPAQRPTTRYDKSNTTKNASTVKQSSRDTKYDKDFDNFYNYRFTHADMLDDYKEGQEARPYWQKVKEDIMTKNKWSEKEFDAKWDAYNKERQQKDADKEVSDAIEAAKKSPVASTLIQQMLFPQELIEGGAAALSNLGKSEEKAQSSSSPLFTGTRVRDAIKQTVKDEHIKSGAGKAAYDIGTGLADMAESMVIPILGTGSLGAKTAARTNMQALDRGVDPDKAAATAGLAGLVSGFMNKVGFNKAAESANLAQAAGIEGLENLAEDVLNKGVDAAINQGQSEIGALFDYYKAQGLDDNAAAKQVAIDQAKEEALSAGTGMLFGGVLKGVPALAGVLSNRLGGVDTGRISPEEAEIQRITEDYQNAADEMARLQSQLPELTNTETDIGPIDGQLSPEEVKILQDVVDGKYDIPETGETAPVEVDPNDVIYHSGILSRLNKADTAGKMEGMRDTGYYGTGHYFVDQAHKGSIGKGTSYGNKPYSSVDISKYNNLYKADTDAKANKLHDFSQKMMRYINGYNDRYYTSDGEINSLARDNYITDLYEQYLSLFPDNHMGLAEFENKLDDMRNNYEYDYYDRGDSAFTTFMKEHGYNGVDTRGTRSADTERGVVIYDLDEDSILQSNVTDADVKNGFMNTRVRNENPVFDTATDERIQGDIDSYNSRKKIAEEYRKLFDDKAHKALWNDITEAQQRISDLENEGVSHYKSLIEDADYLEEAANLRQKEFARMGLDEDIDVIKSDMLNYAKENIDEVIATVEQEKARLAEMQQKYDADEELSKQAYQQAKENVNRTANEGTTKNPTLTIGEDEIAQAKTRHKELSKELVALNKDIKKQQELFDSLENKKSKGAERKAAGQKLAEMKKQAKAIQQEKSELSYQMKGEERPFKRYMQDYDKDAYNAIYGQNGIMGKLDYATHFAGDTPEAIALRDEIKKIINDTVQSGEFPDEADIWNKVEQLDSMARTTKQPFTSKKGKNYDYDTFFAPSNTDEYSGLNMDVVNGYHSALRSHSNKAVTDRITDALNSDTFKPVEITGDMGQRYRIEKGDDGFNIITIGEDGNPVWSDTLKDPNALINKFSKTERDGISLLDEALSAKPAEAPKAEAPKVKEIPTVKETPKAEEAPKNDVPHMDGMIPGETTPSNGEEKIRSFSNRGSKDKSLPDDIRKSLKEDVYRVVRNADTEARSEELFDPNDLVKTRSNLDRAIKDHDPAAASLSYKLAKAYIDAGSYDAATDVIEDVSAELTRGGQFTQAAKLAFLQNDPMAAMRAYKRDLDNINQWGAKKYGKKWEKLELTKEDMDAFNGVSKGDKEALSDVVSKLNTKFSKQIPATMWDKFVGATKVSMLLNTRTQVRNIVANMALLPVRSITDRVSALGQNITHLINPDVKVTQSLTGGTRAQKKAAGALFDKLKDEITGENKMKDSNKSEILRSRQIFNDDFLGRWIDNATHGGLERLNKRLGAEGNKSTMETLANFTYWLMGDFGDTPFVKRNFVNRLASYMKAQGIDNIEDLPDDAIALATQEALKATFKDDNAFSTALQGVKQKSGKFGEVALPFVKTPANLAMRGIDYSPVGLINTFRKLKSGADVSEVIDDLSKNLTGTAMILLGYKLRDKGLLTGSYSEDKDEKAFQKQQGMLENAFHIGDNYITYDWAQPTSTPLLIGSTIYDATHNTDEENKGIMGSINTGFKGALNVTNSWLNTSPLQSVSDLLGGGEYSNENGIAGNIANEIIEMPQRLLPAQLGAIARTNDPIMRDTYSGDQSLTGLLGNQVRQAQAKIPKLSEKLPISYDTWGNPRTRSDTKAEAFLAQNLNPGQLGNKNETPLDKEVQRLFDKTGNKEVFPINAARSLDLGEDGKIKLTPEQHSQYQKEMGQKSYKLAEDFMNGAEYNNLTDDEKAEALSSIYNFSNQLAKEKLFNHVTDSNSKLREIEKEEGPKGVTSYLVDKAKAQRLDLNVETYRKKEKEYEGGATKYVENKKKADALGLTVDTYDKKEAEYQGGAKQYVADKKKADELGITVDQFNKAKTQGGAAKFAADKKAAEQAGFVTKEGSVQTKEYQKAIDKAGKQWRKMENDLPVLVKSGLDKSAIYTYGNALNSSYASTINPSQYAREYNAINTNKDNGMTQNEMLDYLNKGSYTQEEADRLWTIYGDGWKQVPVLKGGKWSKKKKK